MLPPIEPYIRHPVEFREYDPCYPEVAQYVSSLIHARLPTVVVEHMGSTAVPGCPGRGAIDLMVLYTTEPVEEILSELDALGFQWVQRANALPDQWPKGAGAVTYQGTQFQLHIHVHPADHPVVAERRAFRDRLRADPELLAAYVAKKREILAAGVTDPIAYTSAKGDFVQQVNTAIQDS